MSLRAHAIFWSAAFAGLLLFVWVFKSALTPFVLGMAIAYLLEPIVDKLGKLKIGRSASALLILALFFAFVTGFAAALAPILYKELTDLLTDLPGYIQRGLDLAKPWTKSIGEYLGYQDAENSLLAGADVKDLVMKGGAPALGALGLLIKRLGAGGQAAADFISLCVFTPVVAYFMMKEWHKITSWVYDLIPRHSEKDITMLLERINEKIAGFVRGQIMVAFILGVIYACALSIAGLKYGFIIGLGAGALSIIPMVGSAVGLVVSVGMAWAQGGDFGFIAMIAGIFIAGQILEGNFLTPKLVGDSVGLHPLWVFFALLAGGSLFGLLGMFLAVPVAAVIGVLAVYALEKYKASHFYQAKTNPLRDESQAVKSKTAKAKKNVSK